MFHLSLCNQLTGGLLLEMAADKTLNSYLKNCFVNFDLIMMCDIFNIGIYMHVESKYLSDSWFPFRNCSGVICRARRNIYIFSIWILFHEHSQFTGQQEKGEAISLTSLYHFHPLHRHLDISRAITAGSSPLHLASSRIRTGKLWFPSASR